MPHPVHVTVRMLPHVWNLRSGRSWRIIGRALEIAAVRFRTRLCEVKRAVRYVRNNYAGPLRRLRE